MYDIEKTKANLTNQLHFQLSGTEDDMSFALNDNDVFITEILTRMNLFIFTIQIFHRNLSKIYKAYTLLN